MGRKEQPIDRTLRHNAQLAAFLRTRRALGPHSYSELAEHSEYSRHTLQRAAAGGATVPPWPVVASFVAVTARALVYYAEHPDETQRAMERAKSLWRKARYESRQETRPRRPEPPVLALVRDEADLSAVLIELSNAQGRPPWRPWRDRRVGWAAARTALRTASSPARHCPAHTTSSVPSWTRAKSGRGCAVRGAGCGTASSDGHRPCSPTLPPDHPCRIPDHEVHLASSVYPGTAPSNWYVTKPR